MGMLDDLLGNEQLQKTFKDFVNRYQQGDPSEGYSDQEVLRSCQHSTPYVAKISGSKDIR
jgi:hypothetical protein